MLKPTTALLLLLPAVLVTAELVEVQTLNGKIIGESKTTVRKSMTYWNFLGIPFAEPPVGELRFKEPVPIGPWSETRNATQFSNSCARPGNNSVEDCLYLNVFTPQLYPDTPMTVMVYWHGGAFSYGDVSGITPDYYLLRNVVVVTSNYRLGAFGFLSFLHPEIPGNVALKDQLLVLRWIKDNIANFGGDPNQVTITGSSAGSASAHAHTLSPLSKGLFHKVIYQSGNMLCPWALIKNPVDKARSLSRGLHCNQWKVEDVAKCLRNKTVEEITSAYFKSYSLTDIIYKSYLMFGVVVDGHVEGIEPFLPADPRHLMEQGKYEVVPTLAGTNNGETLSSLYALPDFRSGWSKILVDIICSVWGVKMSVLRPLGLEKLITNFYKGIQHLAVDSVYEMTLPFNDYLYAWPTHKMLDLQLRKSQGPYYQYYFTTVGRLNYIREGLSDFFKDIPGAFHLEDNYYLLHEPMNRDAELPEDSPEVQTIYNMSAMWTNFAKTSQPTPEDDDSLNVKWQPYTRNKKFYLEINFNRTLHRDLRKLAMVFWDSIDSAIYKLLNPLSIIPG